jgi:hypothetical protein
LGVKKADEKILMKLANQTRAALSRLLRSLIFIACRPDGRRCFVLTLSEVAVLVHDLKCGSISDEGEQQESQHARQRRMWTTRYCGSLVSHVLSVLPQSAKIEEQLKHLRAALSNKRSAARALNFSKILLKSH